MESEEKKVENPEIIPPPDNKSSWKDAYSPKDFKNDKVLAMISSGTFEKYNQL